MTEQQDRLISQGHDYDGIKEYDNPLPRWWVYLFYITIVFSAWYMGYYTAKGHVLSQAREKDKVLAWSLSRYEVAKVQAQRKQSSQGNQKQDISAMLSDPNVISKGKKIYASNCVACHGAQGEGVVGPNLVDAYWIHGGSPEAIQKTIAKGIPAKGMMAWEPILGNTKVIELTAYVLSIEGIEVENPKPPEGKLK